MNALGLLIAYAVLISCIAFLNWAINWIRTKINDR